MNPQDLINAFFNTGQVLAGQITPYSLYTLHLLVLIEVIAIAYVHMIGGNDDAAALGWSIVRLMFTYGVAYWWIINNWALGLDITGSFDQIGRNIANAPKGLLPSQFFDTAINIIKTLWSAPWSFSFSGALDAAATVDIIIIIAILLGLVAAVAAFSLVATMLIIGPGSIFLAFLPCRFTTSLSENYFVWLVRTGALLLGFYIVLATCQSFAVQWHNALATACNPTAATLPIPSLGKAPTLVPAIVCTQSIPFTSLITLFFDVLLMAVISLPLPPILAALAGHGVNLTLENIASARYLAGRTGGAIAGAVNGLAHQVHKLTQTNNQQTTLQQRLQAGAQAAQGMNQRATTKLSPPPPRNVFGVQRTQGLPQGNGGKPTSRI